MCIFYVKKMFGFLFVAILVVAFTGAQEDEAVAPEDKSECIEKFIKWCADRVYPKEGYGMSIMSISYRNADGYYRVFCSDSVGTNCSKNGSPWFECKPESDGNTLSYKGQVLSDPAADVDDDICDTVDRVTREMFVQDVAFDNATLTRIHEEMKSFFEAVAAVQAEIDQLQKRLAGGPFIDDFWNGFEGVFPRRPEITEEEDSHENPSEENTTKDSNQIEKE